MRHFATLAGILLLAAGIDAAEVKTLDGGARKGDVIAVSDQAIVLAVAGKEETIPTATVLELDLPITPSPLPEVPHLIVRLVDGTYLRCLGFGMKGNVAEARLFNGLALQFPVSALHYVICDAQNEGHRAEFEQAIQQRPRMDVLRVLSRDGKAVNAFEGLIGEVDARGEFVQFKVDGDASRVSMARVRGIYFNRNLEEAPKPVCRVHDAFHNVYAAKSVATAGDAFQITTPLGVGFALPRDFTRRFDFSVGKLAYLSDLEPIKVEHAPILSDSLHFRRDKNLEGGPLSLNYRPYAKGLALHSRTTVEYDVEGFDVFRCLLGIDDGVKSHAHAVVRIDGDGRQLFNEPITNKDKPREVNVKITGVRTLRLTVDYGQDLDLGDHVIFAEARVSK